MTKKTAIIVEDDESLRELVQLTLEMENYTILGAHASTTQALKAMGYDEQRNTVDPALAPRVLITDNDVECEQAGLKLIEKLRGSGIGLLLMSANRVSPETLREAGGNSAMFIAKPFDLDDLLNKAQQAATRAVMDRLNIAQQPENGMGILD